MIVDAIISIAMTVVDTFLSWLPNISPPDLTGPVEAMAPLFAYAGWANKYVPLVEAGALVLLVAGVYLTLWLIKLSVWIYSKLPIIGGGS